MRVYVCVCLFLFIMKYNVGAFVKTKSPCSFVPDMETSDGRGQDNP